MIPFLKEIGLSSYAVVAIIFIVFLFNKLRAYRDHRLSTSKEQLEKLTELFSDDVQMKNHLLVEKYFQFCFKKYIPAEVIFELLKKPNPTYCIGLYTWGLRFLNYNPNQEDNIVSYKKMANTAKRRKWFKIIYAITYFVLCSIGAILLLALPEHSEKLTNTSIFIALSMIIMLFVLAIDFALAVNRLISAEELMNQFKIKG